MSDVALDVIVRGGVGGSGGGLPHITIGAKLDGPRGVSKLEYDALVTLPSRPPPGAPPSNAVYNTKAG
jgi:hypothetical protein